jgi:16S rRNA (adenine1518-N6/adenine1519-N6)-dimethyltransferase
MHPRDILKSYGISPKRSLGQNFIFDNNILARIVNLAELKSSDSVLEIGPGIGSLTRHLSSAAEMVLAVEIDERLIPVPRDQLQNYNNVIILWGDVLKVEAFTYFSSSYCVVANVPYYITGAILRRLFDSDPLPDRAVLTVQREVARRMAASPGNMSLLAAFVQYYAHIEVAFAIKAGSFWPRPNVDSAVVRLDTRSERLIEQRQEADFFRLLRVGFGQKRKQLQKNLRGLNFSREHIQAALQQSGIDGTRRAETLSLDEWKSIFHALF